MSVKRGIEIAQRHEIRRPDLPSEHAEQRSPSLEEFALSLSLTWWDAFYIRPTIGAIFGEEFWEFLRYGDSNCVLQSEIRIACAVTSGLSLLLGMKRMPRNEAI